MAPYVEREWGAKATEMMWRVKRLADPDGILAPGVLLNREPGAHLRNLKSAPEIEQVATQCIECGFCEPVCPSRDLTTTPRQRIALRREMARQPRRLAGAARRCSSSTSYDAIETCAADGIVQPRVPGRHRHRQARQGAAGPPSTRTRAERVAARAGAPLGRRRARRARRAARGLRRRRRAAARAHGARARARCRRS